MCVLFVLVFIRFASFFRLCLIPGRCCFILFVCLLFCVFFVFIEFPSWSLKSFQYLPLSFSFSSKARFPNLSSALFSFGSCRFLGRAALFLRPPRFKFFVPLSSCHAHIFLRNKRFWKKLSFTFCTGNSESQHFLTFLRNLFSRILHTIFSEPIYGLSFFSCFIHFACCLSSSSYSLLRFLHQNVLAKRLNGGVFEYMFLFCSGFCMCFVFSKKLWEWLK